MTDPILRKVAGGRLGALSLTVKSQVLLKQTSGFGKGVAWVVYSASLMIEI